MQNLCFYLIKTKKILFDLDIRYENDLINNNSNKNFIGNSIQILNLCSFYTVDCDSFKEMFSGCNRMIVEIQENIEDYENS